MNKSINIRFLARNLVWNKHITSEYQPEFSLKLNSILQSFKNITYSIFTPERSADQAPNHWHFQGYFEFSKLTDLHAFNKKLAFSWDYSTSFFTDKQTRQGTQQQAIDYVKKEGIHFHRKLEQIDQSYQFGIPKGQLSLYNKSDPQIPKDIRYQKILLNRRLKENYYLRFEDIEHDFEYLYLSDQKWLKNLWDRYHPILKKDLPMMMVYWISGKTGVGKTTLAKHILYNQLGYQESEIAFYKAPDEENPKLWFDKEDQDAKALWIEEVDERYPSRRKLMDIIDRKSRLEVKGSKMRNNFETLLITSYNSPEFNYSRVKDENLRREILRRIFQRDPEKSICLTKVYELRFSKEKDKFNEVLEVSANREELPLSVKKYWSEYFNDQFQSMHTEISTVKQEIHDLKKSIDYSNRLNEKERNYNLFSFLKKLFSKK